MKKTILILIAVAVITGCGLQTEKTSTDYPSAVAWNNVVYGLSITEIPAENIGKEIGQIRRKVSAMPTKNGDSNNAPVGSQLYEVNGSNPQQEVAVYMDGRYYKALKLGSLGG